MAGVSMPFTPRIVSYFGSTLVRSSAQMVETGEMPALMLATPAVVPLDVDLLRADGNPQSQATMFAGTIGGGPHNVVPISAAFDAKARSQTGPISFSTAVTP